MSRAASGERRLALDARTLAKLVRQTGLLALEQWRSESGTSPDAVSQSLEAHLLEHLSGRARHLPRLAAGKPRTTPEEGLVLCALDGADAWSAHVPTWTVAAALLEGGCLSTGVVYAPAVDDLYVASGGVLRWNGEIVPLGGHPPERTGFVLSLADAKRRNPLGLGRRRAPLGSSAYHLALVARGSADGAILEQPRFADLAPGLALLEAAGGEVVDPSSGKPVTLEALLSGRAPRRILASRRGVTAELLRRLRRT